jgi:hypothetical protein
VYFARPTNDVYLEALSSQSSLIAEAVQNSKDTNYTPDMTAAQWFAKRQTQYRTDGNKVRFVAIHPIPFKSHFLDRVLKAT